MNAIAKQTAAQAVHKSIYAALAAAQSAMGPALKEANNPHFRSKYADLGNVMDACLPALNANGIAVVQPPYDDDSGRYVKTIFFHGETGQSIECRVPLIVQKNDMQGYGSAVTYARRYGLMAMAGIAPEDDDGYAAAKAAPKQEQRQHKPQGPTAAEVACDRMANAGSMDQLQAIWADLPKSIQGEKTVIAAKDAAKQRLQPPLDDQIPY